MKFLGLTITILLVAPVLVHGHFFWINAQHDKKEVEVTFSESAGVRDKVIQNLSDKIENGFELYVMQFNGSRPLREKLDWSLEEDRIVGQLSDTVMEGLASSASTVVSGHMDFGPFAEHGIDVDDLQQVFKSDQLLLRRDQKKVAAHEHMKVKPYYMALEGCESNIKVSIHGLSTSTNTNENPISVCVYALGGKEIGCQEAAKNEDDDLAIVTFADVELGVDTAIFAKTKVMFPAPEGESKGTLKTATVTADYQTTCVEAPF